MFSTPISHPNSIHLIRPIRPINFLIRPKRLCKTATVRRSFGPNEKLKEPLLQSRLGRIDLPQ